MHKHIPTTILMVSDLIENIMLRRARSYAQILLRRGVNILMPFFQLTRSDSLFELH